MENNSNIQNNSQQGDEHFEALKGLLLDIAHEVLVNRPLSINHFLAEYLTSKVDKRTLWKLQMEDYLVCRSENASYSRKNIKPSNDSCNNKSHKDIYDVSLLSSESKFWAKESYLAQLARKKNYTNYSFFVQQCGQKEETPEIEKSQFRHNGDYAPNIIKTKSKKLLKLCECFSNDRNSKMNEQAVKKNTELVKTSISSRIALLQQRFLGDSVGIDRSMEKTKLLFCNNFDIKDLPVYKNIVISINKLIDIEKDFRNYSFDHGVYRVLKKTKGSNDFPKTTNIYNRNSGVIESHCLKPSVFKNLEKQKSGNEKNSKASKKLFVDLKKKSGDDLIVDKDFPVISNEKSEKVEETSRPVSAKSLIITAPLADISEVDIGSSNSSSSTTIVSTFEYNNRVLNRSSSTECLLSNLVKDQVFANGTVSSGASLSLSSDEDVAKDDIPYDQLKTQRYNNVVETNSRSSNISEVDLTEHECLTDSEDSDGYRKTKVSTSDARNEEMSFANNMPKVESDADANIGLTRSHEMDTSPFKYIPVSLCLEQHDFFGGEELTNCTYSRLLMPVTSGSKNDRGVKKLKRHFSENDLNQPKWMEYFLRVAFPSFSAQVISSTKPSTKTRPVDLDFKAEESTCDDCILTDSTDEILQQTSVENGVKSLSEGDLQRCSMKCSKLDSFLFHSFFMAENYSDEGAVQKRSASIASKDSDSTLLSEAQTKCSALRSMPWPSFYYQTTWLESSCSLEIGEDSRNSKSFEAKNNQSMIDSEISQDWINIDDENYEKSLQLNHNKEGFCVRRNSFTNETPCEFDAGMKSSKEIQTRDGFEAPIDISSVTRSDEIKSKKQTEHRQISEDVKHHNTTKETDLIRLQVLDISNNNRHQHSNDFKLAMSNNHAISEDFKNNYVLQSWNRSSEKWHSTPLKSKNVDANLLKWAYKTVKSETKEIMAENDSLTDF